MSELKQAIEDVRAQHVQRSCVPGKWRVWRENNDVKIEVFAYALNVKSFSLPDSTKGA